MPKVPFSHRIVTGLAIVVDAVSILVLITDVQAKLQGVPANVIAGTSMGLVSAGLLWVIYDLNRENAALRKTPMDPDSLYLEVEARKDKAGQWHFTLINRGPVPRLVWKWQLQLGPYHVIDRHLGGKQSPYPFAPGARMEIYGAGSLPPQPPLGKDSEIRLWVATSPMGATDYETHGILMRWDGANIVQEGDIRQSRGERGDARWLVPEEWVP